MGTSDNAIGREREHAPCHVLSLETPVRRMHRGVLRMTFPVLIEPCDGQFAASLVGVPHVRVVGPTRSQALDALRAELEHRVALGELLSWDSETSGVSSLAGKYETDPTLRTIAGHPARGASRTPSGCDRPAGAPRRQAETRSARPGQALQDAVGEGGRVDRGTPGRRPREGQWLAALRRRRAPGCRRRP